MALPIDTSAEAIQAQLANAQFNAANAAYDPGSAAALTVLQNTNPSLYLQAVGHAAAVDAAAEAAKRSAAFGNQLGGVDPTTLANMTKSEIAARYGSSVAEAVGDYYIANPSARYQGEVAKYSERQQSTIGSGGVYRQPTSTITVQNPYPLNSAAGIAFDVSRTGGSTNPYLAQNSIAEGYIPSNISPLSGRSTVPVRDSSSGAMDLFSFISPGDETVTVYVPFGNYVQEQILGAKLAIGYNTGELAIYQKPTGHSIYNLVGGGGRNALQSGMFTVNQPETPFVADQWSVGTFKLPSGAGLSRLGAEAYGGFVQTLDNRTLSSDALFSQYPENLNNLANYVNPIGPNLSRVEAPGAKIPWSISASSPALQYMDEIGIIPGSSFTIKSTGQIGGSKVLATSYDVTYKNLPAPFRSTIESPSNVIAATSPSIGTGIFSDVSKFFSSTPGFSFIYGIGESVQTADVNKLNAIIGNTPILSNIRTGGSAFELQSDYLKYSTMGSTPDVIAAQTRYSDASRSLSGDFDPRNAITYGFGKGLQDLGDEYNDLITVPASKILGSGPIGQFFTGLVSTPGSLVSMAGQAIPGAETLFLHNIGNLPAFAATGTAMLLRDAYNSATTNPAGFLGSLTGQLLIFGGLSKITNTAIGYARTVNKEYISIEDIGYTPEGRYPLNPAQSGSLLSRSFSEGKLYPKPTEMAGGGVPAYTHGRGGMPYARLPNSHAGDVTLWTALESGGRTSGVEIGEAFRLETSGGSEVRGMYGAPIAESYFTKVGGGLPQMIGFEKPLGIKTPTIYSTITEGVESLPKSVRATGRSGDYTQINEYIQARSAEVPSGQGYMPLLKAEYEAIIPDNSIIEITGKNYYTKLGGLGESHFGGTRIPIIEMRSIGFEPGVVESGIIGTKTLGERYTGKYPVVNLSDLPAALELATKPYQNNINLDESLLGESDRLRSTAYEIYSPPEISAVSRSSSLARSSIPGSYTVPNSRLTSQYEGDYPSRSYIPPSSSSYYSINSLITSILNPSSISGVSGGSPSGGSPSGGSPSGGSPSGGSPSGGSPSGGSPSGVNDRDYYKRKRKQQPYYIFREILPVITPIEEMSGFKSGKSFFRAIGNQQILEVKPQQRDWLHYVDVDVDIRELEQKSQDTASRTSDLAGMSFFRTATKQEKAKTGKPILKYIPTKQEVDIATLAGIRNTKSKGGKKNPWF
jgi:predicted DNA-binding transcriptional regulator AlpA